MKFSFYVILFSTFFFASGGSFVFASEHPDGDITFFNASNNKITAEVSGSGKMNIAVNEEKNVAYSSLSQVCSATLTRCIANFYVNDNHAGSATINVTTGKLISMHLNMKVHTSKGPQQVLRRVVINN